MQPRHTSNQPTDLGSRHQPAEFATDGEELTDPIVQILLNGDAQTVSEAEEKYLDANLQQVIELVESPLSDEEFRAHPLIALLLSHGSRDWEDSIL